VVASTELVDCGEILLDWVILFDTILSGGDGKMSITKEEAKKLIDKLPEQASWEDIIYEPYVKKKIDASLKAAQSEQVVSHEEVKKRFSA